MTEPTHTSWELIEGEYMKASIKYPGHCDKCDRNVNMVTVQEETHIRGNCPWCGRWMKWIPKEITAGDEILYFGKHKGKPYRLIPRDYLVWVRENVFEKLSKRAQNNLIKYLSGGGNDE